MAEDVARGGGRQVSRVCRRGTARLAQTTNHQARALQQRGRYSGSDIRLHTYLPRYLLGRESEYDDAGESRSELIAQVDSAFELNFYRYRSVAASFGTGS